MNKCYDDIHELISELSSNDRITILSSEIAPGEGREYVEDFVRAYGLTCSAEYAQFFGSIGLIDLRWEVTEQARKALHLEGMYVSGQVHVPPFETVLSDRKLESYWFNVAWLENNTTENTEAENPPMIPIDLTSSDISACSCCAVTGNNIGSELFYFDHDIGGDD